MLHSDDTLPGERSFSLIDARLAEDTHLLRRLVEMPRLRHPEPVLEPAQAYGSVLRDGEGRWTMWYLHGRFKPDPDRPQDSMGYITRMALSDDGLHWSLPSLGKVELDGNTDNNIVMGKFYHDRQGRDLTGNTGPEGFCVIDREDYPYPHTRARYTCLFLSSPSKGYGGLSLAFSDDGIEWEGYPGNPILPGWHDTSASFFYDPRIERYVIYTRPPITAGGHSANRKIARLESPDLIQWSLPRVVLDTDEGDHPDPGVGKTEKRVRGRDRQWYGITAFPWQNLTIGLGWLYDVPSGHMSVELLHSYDGIDWRREPGRELWLTDGQPEGLEGKMYVTMASPPICVDDEMRIYASAANRNHHTPKAERKKPAQMLALSLPQDRWVRYEPVPGHVGALLTQPFQWRGGRIFLNAAIREGGSIKVEVCDALGNPLTFWDLDKIDPLTGPRDDTRMPLLYWGEHQKDLFRLPDQTAVRLRFHLDQASLYGWTLQDF